MVGRRSLYSSVSVLRYMNSLRAGLTWLGQVEACCRYGTITLVGKCEVKQELELDTRQDVWDELRRFEIAVDLCSIRASGIHEAGNSQGERNGEYRLHSCQVSKEREKLERAGSEKFLEIATTLFTIVYSCMSVCH